MNIHIHLPESVERTLRGQFGDDVERRAVEDLAVKWYSEGRLTSGEAAEMLEISWAEAQALLKERGAILPMTIEEFESDLAARRGPDRP